METTTLCVDGQVHNYEPLPEGEHYTEDYDNERRKYEFFPLYCKRCGEGKLATVLINEEDGEEEVEEITPAQEKVFYEKLADKGENGTNQVPPPPGAFIYPGYDSEIKP